MTVKKQGNTDSERLTAREILSSLLAGRVGFHVYGHWLTAATLGNIAGGVVTVSLLNYRQVKLGENSSPESDLRRAS